MAVATSTTASGAAARAAAALLLLSSVAQAFFLAPSTTAASRAPMMAATAAGSRRAAGAVAMQAAPAAVALPQVPFSKYHGIGNDFILIDNRQSDTPLLTPEQAKAMCSRHYSVGADGVIFALPGKDGADYTMRIYNSDGSEPEMCGNGIRCLAKFLRQLEGDDKSGESRSYRISTLAGVIVPVVRGDGLVTVDMGTPILEGPKVPTTLPAGEDGRVINAPLDVAGKTWQVTTVSMGNPHAVIFVPFLDAVDLATLGPKFETHPAFPKKTNTEFVQVISPTLLRMKVWERGAGPTLACGTGACALTVAAILSGKTDQREVTVQLPGGDLQIEWRKADDHVYMTGAAELVYGGTFGAAVGAK